MIFQMSSWFLFFCRLWSEGFAPQTAETEQRIVSESKMKVFSFKNGPLHGSDPGRNRARGRFPKGKRPFHRFESISPIYGMMSTPTQ